MIDARTITNLKIRVAIERKMTIKEAAWISMERRNARLRYAQRFGR